MDTGRRAMALWPLAVHLPREVVGVVSVAAVGDASAAAIAAAVFAAVLFVACCLLMMLMMMAPKTRLKSEIETDVVAQLCD